MRLNNAKSYLCFTKMFPVEGVLDSYKRQELGSSGLHAEVDRNKELYHSGMITEDEYVKRCKEIADRISDEIAGKSQVVPSSPIVARSSVEPRSSLRQRLSVEPESSIKQKSSLKQRLSVEPESSIKQKSSLKQRLSVEPE